MEYCYRDDIATADAAFDARGDTMEELFAAASEALMNVMVEELDSIKDRTRKEIYLEDDAPDMLLFQLLQEFIFYKDAESLLLRVDKVHIDSQNGYVLKAEAYGEEIDPNKHKLHVDVKAVTLHRLRVEEGPKGWEATVVVDI